MNKKYLLIAFLIGLVANLNAGFLDGVRGAQDKASEKAVEAQKKAEEAKGNASEEADKAKENASKKAEEAQAEVEGTEE